MASLAATAEKQMFNLKKQVIMSQKYVKTRNNNPKSPAYGKYFAQAAYDEDFVDTEEIAAYIQQQATLKKSDIIAALSELGEAIKHFFELGQKVRLNGVGIFKVGFSSIGVDNLSDCTAATITTRRILFSPETQRVVVGQTRSEKTGKTIQKYVVAKTLVKDVSFEEVHPNELGSSSIANSTAGSGTGSSNSNTGSNPGSGNGGNGGDGGDGMQL